VSSKIFKKYINFPIENLIIDCCFNLIEEIAASLDERNYGVTIFLDLSKPFDTVNHSILLSKLSYYGIQPSAPKSLDVALKVAGDKIIRSENLRLRSA